MAGVNTRRGFLKALIGAGLVAVADPEKLLWTPGEKTIFIPPLVKPTVQDWWTVTEGHGTAVLHIEYTMSGEPRRAVIRSSCLTIPLNADEKPDLVITGGSTAQVSWGGSFILDRS